jgi:hypothetical protein
LKLRREDLMSKDYLLSKLTLMNARLILLKKDEKNTKFKPNQ